jgi:hypothetical protein
MSIELVLRLIPFLLLVVLTERLTDLHFGRTAVSLGAVVAIAAAASGGPAAGAIVGLANGLAALSLRALSPLKSPFNVAIITLSATVAGLPFWAGAGVSSELTVDGSRCCSALAGLITSSSTTRR